VRVASLQAGAVDAHHGAEEVRDMDVVRVLVVDDVAAYLRAMVAVVAETPGFDVVGEASCGEDALVVATQMLPDLVLMDVHLPGIDGVEATRRLLLGARPPTVVLLSTYDNDAGRQFVAESGATAYVNKGVFSPDRLEQAWSGSRS
jgi:DNA-binding NarL/FixJ family response regulator